MHDGWPEAATGWKVNKRLPRIPDTDNLKLLNSTSMEFAVKDVDINFMSALNTSGSICRRI